MKRAAEPVDGSLRDRVDGVVASRSLLDASVALLTVLMAAAPVSFAAAQPASGFEVGGWLTYWDMERGLGRIEAVGSGALEDVFLFSAALSPSGDVVLVDEAPVVRRAIETLRGHGRRVWLTIVNDVHPADPDAKRTLKDGELVHEILSDSSRLVMHRESILELARQLAVDGIDIDYENLQSSDRELFTHFIALLAPALRRESVRLSVTVQPKHRKSSSRGPGAADWRAICPLVDRLQVMLYNEHSGKTGPGPMATREWMSRVLGFAQKECDPSTIVPVVKLSGMDWTPGGVRSLHYEDSVALARESGVPILRDATDLVPNFSYVTQTGRGTVFFEDWTSVEAKLELLRHLGFTRVVLWSLGREDPRILKRLAS